MKKAVVALSGGVDSAYAARLLLDQGYEAEGLCLDLFAGSKAPEEAAAVAQRLGIKLRIADKRALFRRTVEEYFCRAYHSGLTPNPCALCNPAVKFAALLEAAEELGADNVATGHYARRVFDCASGRYQILRGKDPKKDQSYFLYGLGQEALAKVVFPLGGLTKEAVRAGAARAGLPAAAKRDSQEICFIPGNDYIAFLRGRAAEQDRATGAGKGLIEGDFVDAEGRILGRHKGLACYTVGQRKNLGASLGEKMYVLALRAEENQVVLGADEDLYSREVATAENRFTGGAAPDRPLALTAKLRSGAAPARAVYHPLGEGKGRLVFSVPQRAAAPGQCAVYYDGERLLGGGIIEGSRY